MKNAIHTGLATLVLGLAWALPSLALQGGAEEVTMLRLRSGEIHWGTISDHDPDGLQFTLLSHGGLVRLPWNMVDPTQEQELRERFGYVDLSSEELMIDAELLVLKDGREIVGVILSREGANFLLKVDGNLQQIPKLRVASISSGYRVAALDVYTREDLYTQYSARADAEDPVAQHELAKLCEQILDFQHAVEHYEAALALDPDTDAEEIGFAVNRARLKAEQQEQIDYLRHVDYLRKRKKFDEALARVEAFAEVFPQSPLHNDANKKRVAILRARDDAIADLVQSRWHYWTRKLAREAAKEQGYVSALTYAQETMSEDIQAKVLADVHRSVSEEVQPEQVVAFWAARRKIRYVNASYGFGTWLLGEDKAHAGIEDRAQAEAPKDGKGKERADLEAKIQRFLKNQERARAAQSAEDEADSFESFWAGFPIDARAQWIRAFYAEFSGDVELRPHPYIRACPSCAGKGAREIIAVGGGGEGSSGIQLVKCGTCRGVAAIRRVYYR